MLSRFIFFMILLLAGIISFILYCALINNGKDSLVGFFAFIATFAIIVGGGGSLAIAIEGHAQRSWNNKIVDGIIETPSGYKIYFDDNTYTTLSKDEDITIVEDTDMMKVNTIKMFTYSFEIPGDCIIWQWQPYNKTYGGARD